MLPPEKKVKLVFTLTYFVTLTKSEKVCAFFNTPKAVIKPSSKLSSGQEFHTNRHIGVNEVQNPPCNHIIMNI